ncbi:MAG: hypothetical protein U9N85_02220 [Bacteroidota bacterium]|nr:hypothetical protein [Bacteroidota bacterium]
MKINYLIVLVLAVFSSSLHVQSQVSVDIKLSADTVTTENYLSLRKNPEWKRVYVKMSFASYKIRNQGVLRSLENKKIKKVQLIYTDFPKGQNLTELNNKRLLSLYLHIDTLFKSPGIKWELVKQTGATQSTVYNFYHGFVISYIDKKSTADVKSTKEYFKSIIDGKQTLDDTTVISVLTRNKNWDNMLVVCDFTGSMSPYIGEVMLWHHLTFKSDKKRAYLFFNDGDNKLTEEKEIGNTGGFYTFEGQKIGSLINTAIQAVENGSGGDGPENDVEAILYGIKKFPEKDFVVLIADNWSNMRDFELYNKISKPVKVIICGAYTKLNLQYLNLAYKTGGSVHSLEQDITGLMKMREGESIKINDALYIIKDGEFVPVDNI